MRKLLISLLISLVIAAIKIVTFPIGDNYTWIGEVIFASASFLIAFAICMAVLPDFKKPKD